MPTLIRLFIILLVLAGLVYGGMLALVIMVRPPEELVTIRIPARDLIPPANRDPLVQREIDTSRTASSPPPAERAAEPAADAPADVAPADAAPAEATPAEGGNSGEGSIVTLEPGVE